MYGIASSKNKTQYRLNDGCLIHLTKEAIYFISNKNESHNGWTHTRRWYYALCFVNRHKFIVTRVTHPLVTFQKEVTTLLIPVRVRVLTNEP